MLVLSSSDVCPCGGLPQGLTFAECCQPLLEGARQARTAEELMRSRYTAFAVGDADHLFRTWHPKTRPADTQPEPNVDWCGLDILDTVDGGEDDDSGIVEFAAHFSADGDDGLMRERSTFSKRAGRWLYVDGEHTTELQP